MKLLKHIIEPKRLLIVWQNLQEGSSAGRRYIVGELILAENNEVELRYFKDCEDFKEASNLGFKGYSIFDKDQAVYTQNVMDTLKRRIPPRQRADFQDFLRYYRIESKAGFQMTDFALIGYTGAKLPGDSFSFVHTFENAPIPCEMTIDVAGARHYCQEFNNLQSLVNASVSFTSEPNNPNDSQAVVIKTINNERLMPIGYVNRAQTKTFNKWMQNYHLEGIIERVNGTPEKPNILLYVKVMAE